MISNIVTIEFQRKIIDFYFREGRKDLPWRQTSSPWKILLAEILLRKTTSAQALQIFNQIKDLQPLDLATIDEKLLIELLRPLGMYKVKAEQIASIAREINQKGVDSLEDELFLRSLSGVGNYIVNCILCFGYGKPKPALDTNMIRVLTRVFGFKTTKARAREDKDFWNFAESLVPKEFCREYNWGILDLAWMICKPRNPFCGKCPISSLCKFNMGDTNDQRI